jgi:hypothetical protein
MVGVDDPPRPSDVLPLEPYLPVRDDRPRIVVHDPGVLGEIEAQPAPLLTDEVRPEERLIGDIELIGVEQVTDRIHVVVGRCPRPVSVGEGHAREGSRRYRPEEPRITRRTGCPAHLRDSSKGGLWAHPQLDTGARRVPFNALR